MLVAGAGDAAGKGAPEGHLPLEARSAGLTKPAHVASRAEALFHPGGWPREAWPRTGETDLLQGRSACGEKQRRSEEQGELPAWRNNATKGEGKQAVLEGFEPALSQSGQLGSVPKGLPR